MSNKFILGGGISGLIYAYYNRDFTIISPDIGGKLNNKFFENIFYMHATKETEEFLNDIGIEYKKKTQLIKYAKDNKIVKDISIEDKILFIQKKLNDFDFIPKDLNLSTSDYYISVFELNYGELLTKLTENLHYINDSVIKITKDEIITENTRFKYDKLVSTINSKIFWKLYVESDNKNLKSKDITFILCNKTPDFLENEKFELCYFINKESEITRVSKRTRNQANQYLYEFTGNKSLIDCKKCLPKDSEVIEYYVEKDGIIFSDDNNIPPNNIVFLGRFATWNHSYKQQDVIKSSKVSFDFQNVWNIQKRFTSNFVDFNKLDNDIDRESFTKEYIIALLPELTEVLNEINYKQHKQRKKVNKDFLVEELIDVFKYYLNILLMWGIEPEDFLEKYIEKSNKVNSQYQEFKNNSKK